MTEPVRGPDQQYLAYLSQGSLRMQREPGTSNYVFYPRAVAPETGSRLEWAELTGLGRVYATTTVRSKPPAADYNVCVVELDEGPRMMSRVESVPALAVRIGMRVRARIVTGGEMPFVVFDPVEAE